MILITRSRIQSVTLRVRNREPRRSTLDGRLTFGPGGRRRVWRFLTRRTLILNLIISMIKILVTVLMVVILIRVLIRKPRRGPVVPGRRRSRVQFLLFIIRMKVIWFPRFQSVLVFLRT